MQTHKTPWFLLIGPGLLVAATGVGAGDLATASFSGAHLGVAVLWAVVVGGVMKVVLTEGLARWQLATGQTLLEGLSQRMGWFFAWLFLPYLVLWSFFVGAALISACGVTLHALLPVFDSPSNGKIFFGVLSSLIGLVLVLLGGFKLFEKVMMFCIGLMFCTVILTAAILWPGWTEVLQGLLWPRIPDAEGQGLAWTVALIGGVGGTLTILCYGYWIREKGRVNHQALNLCRIDLATGYVMTVIFGLAMVIIGSQISVDGKGSGLLVSLAGKLEEAMGPVGYWLFLIGAFGAVFSSLLGVWQAVPYLFADVWRMSVNKTSAVVDSGALPYRAYLIALAIIPMLGLLMSFKEAQKLYAIVGAAFMPLLALALLLMNRRKNLGAHATGWLGSFLLILTLGFFGTMAGQKWLS